MGRQIAVAMLPEDETRFVQFLRSTTEIRLFRWSAPSPSQLEVFGTELGNERSFYIWPTAFKWEPEFSQFGEIAVPESRGRFYLRNTSAAPLLEYSRHGFEPGQAYGRLYWSKTFAAPVGLDYDSAVFETWYERVVRWVRKNGQRYKAERSGPYYLPQALAKRSAA